MMPAREVKFSPREEWGLSIVDAALAHLSLPGLVDNRAFVRNDDMDIWPVYEVRDPAKVPISIALNPLQLDICEWSELILPAESVADEQLIDQLVSVMTSHSVIKYGLFVGTLCLRRPQEDRPWLRVHRLGVPWPVPSRSYDPLFG